VPAGTFASAAIWTTHLQLSGKSHEKSFNQRSGRQSEALFNSLLSVDRSSYGSKYKGYDLTACAKPTHRDLYAADVAIDRPGCSTRHFLALDYFYTAAEALRYATRWGKLWIDHRLQKVAVSAKSIDTVERNA